MAPKKKTDKFCRVVMANHKGGTGKTTLAYIDAVGLAKRGYSVCLMDFDPQCNLSKRFLEMETDPRDPESSEPPPHKDFDAEAAASDEDALPEPRPSTGTLLMQGWTHEYATDYDNLTIVPGDYRKLMQVEDITKSSTLADLYNLVNDALIVEPYWRETYDVIVMDTGPNKGSITTCAIQMASHLLIPFKLEELSVEGLRGMLAYWMRQNLTRPTAEQIELLGLQCNMVKSGVAMNKYYLDQLLENDRLAPYLLPQHIHNWQAYAEMMVPGFKHVLDLPPNNPARPEAEQVIDGIERALFGGVA